MPACVLANGISVAQVETDQVEYWHVEFDSHDILLAEGLPAESFSGLQGNRDHFINHGALREGFSGFQAGSLVRNLSAAGQGGAAGQTDRRRRLLALLLENGFELTEKAGVHVLADGRWIAPTRLSGQRFTFRPAGSGEDHSAVLEKLRSRACRAGELRHARNRDLRGAAANRRGRDRARPRRSVVVRLVRISGRGRGAALSPGAAPAAVRRARRGDRSLRLRSLLAGEGPGRRFVRLRPGRAVGPKAALS